MRILAEGRPDYFDFISHTLGADPDCVYVRRPLKETHVQVPGVNVTLLDGAGLLDSQRHRRPDYRLSVNLSYIVAGLRCFGIVSTSFDGGKPRHVPYDAEMHGKLLKVDIFTGEPEPLPTFTEEYLAKVVRAVGVPVFRVVSARWGGEHQVDLDSRIPILADYGIPALCSPRDMWQNIYTTMTSVLRRDPDKEPPVKIGNDDRVEAAGFDLKSSFRHPVKLSHLRDRKPKRRERRT